MNHGVRLQLKARRLAYALGHRLGHFHNVENVWRGHRSERVVTTGQTTIRRAECRVCGKEIVCFCKYGIVPRPHRIAGEIADAGGIRCPIETEIVVAQVQWVPSFNGQPESVTKKCMGYWYAYYRLKAKAKASAGSAGSATSAGSAGSVGSDPMAYLHRDLEWRDELALYKPKYRSTGMGRIRDYSGYWPLLLSITTVLRRWHCTWLLDMNDGRFIPQW